MPFQSLQGVTNELSNSFSELFVALKSIISPLDNIVKIDFTIFTFRSAMAAQFRTLALRAAPILMKMAFDSIDSEAGIIADLKRRRNTACTKRIKSNFAVIRLNGRIMEVKHVKRNSILTNTQRTNNTLALFSLLSTMARFRRLSFPDSRIIFEIIPKFPTNAGRRTLQTS